MRNLINLILNHCSNLFFPIESFRIFSLSLEFLNFTMIWLYVGSSCPLCFNMEICPVSLRFMNISSTYHFPEIHQNPDLLIPFPPVCNTFMNVFPLYFFDVPSLGPQEGRKVNVPAVWAILNLNFLKLCCTGCWYSFDPNPFRFLLWAWLHFSRGV